MESGDDAGVFSLGNGRVLVQTIDIFTPVVDSASDWGRIAAVNALSDLFAMGATPLTALQFIGWPRDQLGFDVAGEVVKAGMDVMAEEGCTVVGGHSIDAPEPTYGFAVTGVADEGAVVTNAGASPGDSVVLTKPIGLGIITTAIKRGKCPADVETSAIAVMEASNRRAGLALSGRASAATDVTGFGLIGHLLEMCAASDVGMEISFADVPVLEGASELFAQRMWPGGSSRNWAAFSPAVHSDLDDSDLKLLVDAQTSGGLAATLPSERLQSFLDEVPGAQVIGEVTSDKRLRVT